MIRNRTIPLPCRSALLGLHFGACSSGTDTDTTTNNSVPSGCTEVPVATSPEKFTLLTGLAETFNATGQEFDGECAAITVYRVSSGAAARMLVRRLADRRIGRARPGLVESRGQHLGRGCQPAPLGSGTASDRQRLPADHADSAGAGNAPADGRGHGMARSRDRLVRHPRPRLGSRGMGVPRPSRSGETSDSARPIPTSRRRGFRLPPLSTTPPPARPPG